MCIFTHLFSPWHSSSELGSALGLSKTLAFLPSFSRHARVVQARLCSFGLSKTFLSVIHSSDCLPSTCRGLAPRVVGGLVERRHARSLLVFLVLCCRQHQRGLLGLHVGQREPVEQREPRQCLIRALRPASTRSRFLSFRSRRSQKAPRERAARPGASPRSD